MREAQRAPVKGMYLRGKTWWLRYTPGLGAPQARVSLETESESAAAAAAIGILNAPALVASQEFTAEMEAYFAEGLKNEKLAAATVDRRRKVLEHFAATCGITRPQDITTEACERWLAVRRKTSLPLTVQTYFTQIAGFCSWLVRKQKIRVNPTTKVEMGKIVVTARKNFLPKDTIRDLIINAPNDDLRFILFCGFHAGMRKLEITEARPDWFRLAGAKGSINIRRTPTYKPKDKEERTVPLSAEFTAFLTGYLAKLPAKATWVLRPSERGINAIYRIFFDQELRRYMQAQKVRCSTHDMRRSFVSNKLIEDGRLVFKLARWTGTDIQTLQKHYGHLLVDDGDIEAGL
jgi:integrase